MALALCGAFLVGGLGEATAETELSAYIGFQEAAHGRLQGDDPGGVGAVNELIAWEGRSFSMPPYYGFRATWWRANDLGFGIEFNHAKVYASDESLAATGFSRLEMTDGLNLVTANAFKRWSREDRDWTSYAGLGVGVAIPHVDIKSTGGTTYEYQLTGPAVQAVAGISYPLAENRALFGEYKFTYSWHDVDLASGGSLETQFATNAVNFGYSWSY
ncbi:MAG: lipid A oxidase [Rhodobacteraceae bacterium]|nr:lipid A oxidase [Paracoccaceae bacterium]